VASIRSDFTVTLRRGGWNKEHKNNAATTITETADKANRPHRVPFTEGNLFGLSNVLRDDLA